MRWFKRFFVVLVLLLVAGVGFMVYGLYNIDSLVKAAIEKYGSEAISSQVLVGQVNVNLKDGKVILKNLSIDNPAGFTEKTAFSAGYIEIDLDEDKLNTSKVTLTKVLVKEPLVTYEHANGQDNLSTLQKNAVTYAQKMMGSDTKKSSNSNGTKVLIHNIDLNDGKIFLKDARLMGASITLPLPNIHISQIQTGPDGSSPQEIAGQVMESLLGSSRTAVSQSATSVIQQGEKGVEGVGKALKDAGDGVFSKAKKLFSN